MTPDTAPYARCAISKSLKTRKKEKGKGVGCAGGALEHQDENKAGRKRAGAAGGATPVTISACRACADAISEQSDEGVQSLHFAPVAFR